MEFRNDLSEFNICDERKDDLIRFLDAVASSFVDQKFGKSTTQLSLSSRANYAFIGTEAHANVEKSENSELVDLDIEGAKNTDGPTRHRAP